MRYFIANALLVLGSVIFVFLGLESYLWIDSLAAPPPKIEQKIAIPAAPKLSTEEDSIPAELIAFTEARKRVTTMPDEWKMREIEVPGAAHAYSWQGVVHVVDENGFRRTTPFPPKDPNVFRVMVLGDSLTYGA